MRNFIYELKVTGTQKLQFSSRIRIKKTERLKRKTISRPGSCFNKNPLIFLCRAGKAYVNCEQELKELRLFRFQDFEAFIIKIGIEAEKGEGKKL